MKPTIESILQNQLNRIHAEIIMTAYSESIPGWSEQKSEPDFYRFCYTEKGQGWLNIQNVSYTFQPGTLFLLPAGTQQSFGTDGDEPFRRFWCHFRLELGDIQFLNSLQLPAFVHVQDEQMMKQLFSKMIALQACTSITRELRLKSVLLELLAYYLDEARIQKDFLNDPGFGVKWNDVLSYIESNLHANIQVEKLAKLAFLHPNYFISSFKNIMGCSPIQYVTNRRITAAKQLLTETTLPVAAVAAHVGMQNHYLSRLFKRYTGVTPVQYRRIAKQGAGHTIDNTGTTSEEGNS